MGRSQHCGHKHEKREEAEKCLLEYVNKCRKQNLVSDRMIVETESIEELEDEMQIY